MPRPLDLWGVPVEAPAVEAPVKPIPLAPTEFALRTWSVTWGGYWKLHPQTFPTRDKAEAFIKESPAYRRAIIYELRDPLRREEKPSERSS